MKAPWSSPLFLCLPLWAWTSGDKPKGQRLQREGLGTKLLLCGPSSKISPLIVSLVTMATRKLLCRREIKYCCHSPCHLQSSGGACHILARDRHFYTQAIPLRSPSLSSLCTQEPWTETKALASHTRPRAVWLQVGNGRELVGLDPDPYLPACLPATQMPHSF